MADNVTNIKDQLGDFVSKEAELAKAEIVPAVKKAGVGIGMFAVSLAFVLHAVWMFVIALAALFTWLTSLTGIGTPLSLIFGFLIAMMISLIFGGIFARIGMRQFKQVKAPEATIAEFKATVNAIADGWARKEDPAKPIKSPDPSVTKGNAS